MPAESKRLKRQYKMRRKLYCLRLKRLSSLFLNYQRNDLLSCLLGRFTYNALYQCETFESFPSSSDRQRILCMMWIFLSRHDFLEAAKLLIQVIHTCSMSPAWIWRAAFQIFRCTNNSKGLYDFRTLMKQFQLTDENNQTLELILFMMTQGHWELAASERTERQKRPKSRGKDPSREPELLHVQRLHRLYEGLSHYVLANINRDTPGSSNHLSKAEYRLSEVESFIECGHVCDIFLRPLVIILLSENRQNSALQLLESYAARLPTHPNAHRYLAEWYIRTQSSRTEFPVDDLREALQELLPIGSQTDDVKMPPLLRHLVNYATSLLPMRAPKVVNESNALFFVVSEACCSLGFYDSALEIAFKLLDNPSWCRFSEPWNIVRRCVEALGTDSAIVSRAWSLSAAHWKRYVFPRPDLPPDGKVAKDLLKSVPMLEESQFDQPSAIDEFGIVLNVKKLQPNS